MKKILIIIGLMFILSLSLVTAEKKCPLFVSLMIDDPPVGTTEEHKQMIKTTLEQMDELKITFAIPAIVWDREYWKSAADKFLELMNNPLFKHRFNAISHSYYHFCGYDCEVPIDAEKLSGTCSFTSPRTQQELDISQSKNVYNNMPKDQFSGATQYFLIPCGGFSSTTTELLKSYGYRGVIGGFYWTDSGIKINYDSDYYQPYYLEKETTIPLISRTAMEGKSNSYILDKLKLDIQNCRPIIFYAHNKDFENMDDFGPKHIKLIDGYLKKYYPDNYYYKFTDEALNQFIAFDNVETFDYNDSTKIYTITGKNPKMYHIPDLKVYVYQNGKLYEDISGTYPKTINGEGTFIITFEELEEKEEEEKEPNWLAIIIIGMIFLFLLFRRRK